MGVYPNLYFISSLSLCFKSLFIYKNGGKKIRRERKKRLEKRYREEMRCSTEEERGIRKRESLIITTRPSPRVAQLHSLGLARRRKSNRREETIENGP